MRRTLPLAAAIGSAAASLQRTQAAGRTERSNVVALPRRERPQRRRARIGTGVAFIAIGVLHFVKPATFDAMIPEKLPAKRFLTLFTGACEIAGGVGLLFRRTARPTAAALTPLVLAMWSANIDMAVKGTRVPGLPAAPRWALWARVPLQIPMILSLWWATADCRQPGR